MTILPGEGARDIVLEFSSASELDSFFAEADEKGYFFLQTERLPEGAVFRARCADSPRTRRIRPVGVNRVRGGYEVRLVAGAPSAPAAVPADSEPEEENESVRKSLDDRIRQLTVSERVTLALKADLMERRILMKENNPKIHEFLLRNTRITDPEIAFMARNPTSPMQTILAIANRKEYMNREMIRSAVLVNPRTPAHLVLEMLPAASSTDLLKMFHAKHLREDVQAAVRQEMKKRGLRPKRVAD